MNKKKRRLRGGRRRRKAGESWHGHERTHLWPIHDVREGLGSREVPVVERQDLGDVGRGEWGVTGKGTERARWCHAYYKYKQGVQQKQPMLTI